MITKEEIEADFRKDFQDLLNKYKTEIEIRDHYRGYSECGEDIRAMVVIYSVYDDSNDLIREHTEFDLGRYLKYEELANEDT